MPRLFVSLFAALLLCSSTLAAESKRVLLLYQGPDGHPPATHEYKAGLTILQHCLSKVDGVQAELVAADEPWTDGPDKLKDADGIVIYLCEGAKWASADSRRLQALAALASRGGGIVGLHWGIGTKTAEPIPAFVNLLGGCHGGPDRKYQVLQDARLKVVERNHPVTHALPDFSAREELYYQLKFVKPTNAALPGTKTAITPILQAEIDGTPHTISWAWERPDGGRSFGFSGLHFHDNWEKQEYRRLVTQAVMWTVNVPVPAAGVNVDVPDELFSLNQ
jgi:type 1 glutamine amidotransferase